MSDPRARVAQAVGELRRAHRLERFRARRALVAAPFGREHVASCARRLCASRAVRALADDADALLLVIVERGARPPGLPAATAVLEVDGIPGWPRSDAHRNRFFKWALPRLFPEIGASVYVDSDLLITSRPEKLLRAFRLAEEAGFVVTRHDARAGWREELAAALARRPHERRALLAQRDAYAEQGLPDTDPVYQNNVVARDHASPLCALGDEVLAQLLAGSSRDQLALVYAAHRLGQRPRALPEGELLYTGFGGEARLSTLAFVDPDGRARLLGLERRLGRRARVGAALRALAGRGTAERREPIERFWADHGDRVDRADRVDRDGQTG